MKSIVRKILFNDLFFQLKPYRKDPKQQSSEYLEWINTDLVDLADAFVQQNHLLESPFIQGMNTTFKTRRFNVFLKRWIVEYLLEVFKVLENSSRDSAPQTGILLEDNPLNRFAADQYSSRFNIVLKINWRQPRKYLWRWIGLFSNGALVLALSFKNGVKFSTKKKQFKVLREALWGLSDVRGFYFHDDFMVDGKDIKEEDLVLFSRGIPQEPCRLQGYHDAKRSPYAHFNLNTLSIGFRPFWKRVIPKYLFSAQGLLLSTFDSKHHSLFSSLYLYFAFYAVAYERVFSHFDISSELGHNYFTANHIAEAIVCEGHGTRYYLMHWSDNAIGIDKYLLSFLGCDHFLVWGHAHVQGVEGADVLKPIGYVFKKFINTVKKNRIAVLSEMKINRKGKIITFFDESFGGICKMTERHYIQYWRMILKAAERYRQDTIVVKPKEWARFNNLADSFKKEFLDIKARLDEMPHVYILDQEKWSFIEAIGVSDVVVTQGMTSSSTIALVCGIPALYFDEARYRHPLSERFKDKIVFDDPEKFLKRLRDVIDGKALPLKIIPESLLRTFDAYADDNGIDRLRDILIGKDERTEQAPLNIGIIVQARMGAERLPGKVIKPLLDRPMLEVLITRLKRCQRVYRIIIATSENAQDEIIARLAYQSNVDCFRGDEANVLSRYYHAARQYQLDTVVRITADCPLMDPALVDKLVSCYEDNPAVDYVSNTLKRTYPRGFDVEVFSGESLQKAFHEADQDYQKEHVTPYIYEHMKTLNYENLRDDSQYRVTVDTPEDYRFVTEVYTALKQSGGDVDFGYQDVIDLLKKRSDLVVINQHITQKSIR